MTVFLSFQEMAEKAVSELPNPCTSGQFAKLMGLSHTTLVKWLKAENANVLKTPGGHLRIPRAVQKQFMLKAIQKGHGVRLRYQEKSDTPKRLTRR